jgi:hypothetical protein
MDYRSLTGVLFLTGVPSGDACVFLSFDDLRTARLATDHVMWWWDARCLSPPQG